MARLITYQEVLEKRAAEGVAASKDSGWVDHIVGGQAEGADPSQFDPEQLALGAKEEMEHTSDPVVAAEIAMDHLIKDPEYYQKLKLIEGDQENIDAAKVAGVLMAKVAKGELSFGLGLGTAAMGNSGAHPELPLRMPGNIMKPTTITSGALGAFPTQGGVHPMRAAYDRMVGDAANSTAPKSGALPMNLKKPQMAMGGGAAPSPGRLMPAAKAAPAATAVQKAAPKAIMKASPAAAGPSKALGALKVPWGKALALGGLGAGLYGVAKALPWLTRELTSASSMPLAYSGGWSPVPYGYGYSPYGEGQPNLGAR